MKKKKILFGICGIGNGHTFRQLPLVTHFARHHQVMIFAYGESYAYYTAYFGDRSNVTIERVAVPFYMGNKEGLDFAATGHLLANLAPNYLEINCAAMARASEVMGTPDLVISDYEPTAAQYGYACGAPVVTIDQQSKYLCSDLPATLNGQSCKDEITRLRMFFPQCAERIACSFFRVPKKRDCDFAVRFYPPMLREAVYHMQRPNQDRRDVLVYLSSQQAFLQSLEEIGKMCEAQKGWTFHVFAKGSSVSAPKTLSASVSFYEHGDPRFDEILERCAGVVSTAGHTLLSEAMYLGIPVYAMPLPLYEQQMNAYVMQKYGFGLSCAKLEKSKLTSFLKQLPAFEKNIKKDKKILLRSSVKNELISFLEKRFLSS